MNVNQEQACFYFEIGLAITQWSHVERALYGLAAECFTAPNAQALGIGYYSIENFRSKLQFVDNLLQNKFEGKPAFQEWPAVRDRTSRASAKRNKLAHYYVMGYPEGTAGRRYALLPVLNKNPPERAPRGARAPSHAICVRNLLDIRFEFFSLMVTMENFKCRLTGLPITFQVASEIPMAAPRLPQIREQMQQMMGVA